LRDTVLLVDDEEEIRENLAELLVRRGFDVIAAANGREALDKVHEHARAPEIIVLDMMMPVMDGQTFLQAQSADPLLADVPVLIISARLRRPEPLPAAVRGVLVKPISLNILLGMIKGVRDEVDRAGGAS
jgi:CheY-like chemotaxis protein